MIIACIFGALGFGLGWFIIEFSVVIAVILRVVAFIILPIMIQRLRDSLTIVNNN
jgi:hypothetical protein